MHDGQPAGQKSQHGCYDLDRAGLLRALETLKTKAKVADTAFVFYAGHGLETHGSNFLLPVDAKIDCRTWGISRGVLIDDTPKAIEPATHKFFVLDACRDNPLGARRLPAKRFRSIDSLRKAYNCAAVN